MGIFNFYQGKTDYHYGGYYIGFGIRHIKWLPSIWVWFSDFRQNRIMKPKKFKLQFCFSLEDICKTLGIFKRFYNIKIKHD